MKKKVGVVWAAECKRLLGREVVPILGDKRLGEVKRSDIHGMLDAIVDRPAPVMANRTLRAQSGCDQSPRCC